MLYFFGAKLSEENEVIMITNGKAAANIINDNGLTLKEMDNNSYRYDNVKAFASGTYEQPVDIAVVLVKTTATRDALKQNRALIGDKTLVLTLQNGLGNYEKLAEYVKKSQIILGTTNHNSVLYEEGKVFHSGEGVTVIGSEYVPEEYLQKVWRLLVSSGFECKVVDDIGYLIWKKLFINLAINTLTYITLTPMGFIGQNKYTLDIIEKVIIEAAEVAKAEGYDFDWTEEFENVKKVSEAHKMGYSSMSQDRKRGCRTEIDAINGAMVRLAKRHRIRTPYNEMLTNLIHAIEEADTYNKNLAG